MRYSVQFLDGSAVVIDEWRVDAQNTARAMELISSVSWPTRAVRVRIFDADGGEVHDWLKEATP